MELRRHARSELDRSPVIQGLEQAKAVPRVLQGIEREGRGVLGKALPVRVARLFLMKVARVGQEDPEELQAGRRAVDRAGEALLDEARQEPRVVDMGVREQHGVQLRRLDRDRLPIPEPEFLEALEQAAIHEDPRARRARDELGARHRARAAEELYPRPAHAANLPNISPPATRHQYAGARMKACRSPWVGPQENGPASPAGHSPVAPDGAWPRRGPS